MEQIESIQKANRQRRLAEWSQRVEACRSSGLPVGRWCQENGIAVSTYFAWQRKVFKTLKEIQEVTFAEVPVMKCCPPSGQVVASLEISGVRGSRFTRERIRPRCRRCSRRRSHAK